MVLLFNRDLVEEPLLATEGHYTMKLLMREMVLSAFHESHGVMVGVFIAQDCSEMAERRAT